jgi:hypothetical protein
MGNSKYGEVKEIKHGQFGPLFVPRTTECWSKTLSLSLHTSEMQLVGGDQQSFWKV